MRESAPKYKYDGAAEGVCPRPRVLRGRVVVDARSVLERDGREDRRHRPGEHRPAARAVRVFPGGAARLALDL